MTNQVTGKLLAHTVGVWLNLQHGRKPLQFDGLIIARSKKSHITLY
ncbi:MAG: hypothetical protein V9G98_27350 [Candidatus Competibacter sp.]